ncbi:hypothetical protein CXG81DRAFT_5792, partial [Caulochytrium protostelioides]
LDFEGIYRKSGPLTQVNRIIAAVNEGQDSVQMEDEMSGDYVDIMAVTSIVKQFFRELPDPLVPYAFYDQLTQCVRDLPADEPTDAVGARLAAIVRRFPRGHYTTLRYLIRHLANIAAFEDVNKMSRSNLGVVFGPTVMRPRSGDALADMADIGIKSQVVELLIAHVATCF